MKKMILVGFIISIVIFGYFYLNRADNELKKSLKIEKITKSDKNITLISKRKINQKPMVDAGDDQNITFGEEVTLEAIAKDRDGKIVYYLWQEGNETLSEESSFSYKFNRGVHHLKVTVVDNDGAKAEDNVTVNVGFWLLEKIVINNESSECGTFKGEIKYEYNSDGKIVKAMLNRHRDSVINEVYYYGYDEEGRDAFEALDFNNDGIIDRNRSKSFYENGNIKEESFVQYKRDGRVSSINKTEYAEDGRVLKETTEYFIREYHYNENHQLVEVIGIENGEMYLEKEYHYNGNNQLLEVISVDNGKPKVDEKYYYVDGLLVEKEIYEGRLYRTKEFYIYEGEELKKKKKLSYNDGTIQNTIIDYFNEKGQRVKEIYNGEESSFVYDEFGRLSIKESAKEKEHYFYDSQGDKIREERYERDENGEFTQQWYTVYSEDEVKTLLLRKNITFIHSNYDSKRHITGSIMIYQKREVYDDYGNLIEIWDDADGKLVEKRFYRFVVP